MNSIMAIQVKGRDSKAPHLQEVLTKYGCSITTRVGFHETNDENCSMNGIIILQLSGKDSDINDLYNEVKALNGITPKFIEF